MNGWLTTSRALHSVCVIHLIRSMWTVNVCVWQLSLRAVDQIGRLNGTTHNIFVDAATNGTIMMVSQFCHNNKQQRMNSFSAGRVVWAKGKQPSGPLFGHPIFITTLCFLLLGFFCIFLLGIVDAFLFFFLHSSSFFLRRRRRKPKLLGQMRF